MNRFLDQAEELALFVPVCVGRAAERAFDAKLQAACAAIGFTHDGALAYGRVVHAILDRLSEEFMWSPRPIGGWTADPGVDLRTLLSIMGGQPDKMEQQRVAFEAVGAAYALLAGDQIDELLKFDIQLANAALVQTNINRVYKITGLYRDYIDADDLVQDGSLGIIYAIRDFRPWYGVRFGTFCTWKIRGLLTQTTRSEQRQQRQLAIEIDADRTEREVSLERLNIAKRDGSNKRNDIIEEISNTIYGEIAFNLDDYEKLALLEYMDAPEEQRHHLLRTMGLAEPDVKLLSLARRRVRRKLAQNQRLKKLFEALTAADEIRELAD